jgi:hypothetical protein
VASCDWCVSLDRIPQAFYEEIRTNKAQVREWIDPYAIDDLDERTDKVPIHSENFQALNLLRNKTVGLDRN